MYKNIKYCVFIRNESKYSDYFICNCGVRQGESLSPILFAVFLNDLEDYLDSRANSGVVLETFDDNLFQFIKILELLFADDTILMSDNPTSFQKSLNDFVNYCQE